MLVLELFSGTGSVGTNAKKRGYKVISVDSNDKTDANIVVDILNWDYKKLKLKPDVVWASPPCGSFSNMAITADMKALKPYTTSNTLYCLYKDNRKKPTDFFNNFDLELKSIKSAGNCGASVGVVNVPLCDRYKIPQKLLDDIFNQIKKSK